MRALLAQLFDTLIVLFGVSALVFLLLALIPGDPVDVILGESARPADRAAMQAALGLDQPLTTRFWEFYRGLLQGDLGDSLIQRQPVLDLVLQRLPATVQLAGAAFVLVVLISLPLGTIAAWRQGEWPDRTARLFALVGVSIPNFWLGPLLVLAFSVHLGWTPVSGSLEPGSLVLPAMTLGLSMAAITTRMVRSSLLEIAGQPFLRTARCKGLAEGQVLLRHALPNAVLPVVTVLGLQLGALLAGAVITEVVFAWPGIGSLLIDAIRQRDYPVVQGVVLLIAIIYVLVNRGTDLLAATLDPRIRDSV